MVWVGVIYNGKCNYYVLINCNRYFIRKEFIQNDFHSFIFLLIWDNSMGSHTNLSQHFVLLGKIWI